MHPGDAMPEPTIPGNETGPGGQRPFIDRPRRPMIGAGFTEQQIEVLRGLLDAQAKRIIREITGAAPAIPSQPAGVKNTGMAQPPVLPASFATPTPAEVKATSDAINAPAPGGPPPEAAKSGLPLATEENTPGATAGMLALINEQTDAAKHEALRAIAMEDTPHQARLPKMRQYLAANP